MSRALHVRSLTQHIAPKKLAKAPKEHPKPTLALVPKEAPHTKVLVERTVEVLDRDGHSIAMYSIVLEGENCHNGEYEEVALIFAEQSGRIATEEFVHLRARCV